MAINALLHVLTFTLLITLAVSSSDPPESSPSPSPTQAPAPAPPPQSGNSDDSISVDSASPSPSPTIGSPPLHSPSDLLPDRYMPPAYSPAPAPAPAVASDDTVETEDDEPEKSSSGGMSGGKKVGVAFGLIAAACFVGFGGVLYRKRQQNIRRARYSQAARLEFF